MTVIDELAGGLSWPTILELHGVPAVYDAPDQAPYTLTVVAETERDPEPEYGPDGVRMIRKRGFYLGNDPTADSGGLASVNKRGSLTLDAETWAIETAAKRPGGLWYVIAHYSGLMERTREGQRRE